MANVLRTLVFDGQVSLTIADTTEIVKEGIKLHRLSPVSAHFFGKALCVMTYMSACLKDEKGEISLSLKTDGEGQEIAVSGNKALRLRGYVENTQMDGIPSAETEKKALGTWGALTIIRDDGYNRPFVGTCAIPEEGGVDEAFEEYYRVSEQLPTRIVSTLDFDEQGQLVFAGVVVLQPLPFAEEAVISAVNAFPMEKLLAQTREKGVEKTTEENFGRQDLVWELRQASYKCNCSRDYLTRVIVSLGEAQTREVIREDGAVRIHCHYCNTDYEFTEEDADKIFT